MIVASRALHFASIKLPETLLVCSSIVEHVLYFSPVNSICVFSEISLCAKPFKFEFSYQVPLIEEKCSANKLIQAQPEDLTLFYIDIAAPAMVV